MGRIPALPWFTGYVVDAARSDIKPNMEKAPKGRVIPPLSYLSDAWLFTSPVHARYAHAGRSPERTEPGRTVAAARATCTVGISGRDASDTDSSRMDSAGIPELCFLYPRRCMADSGLASQNNRENYH
jgi:hypothetical protein